MRSRAFVSFLAMVVVPILSFAAPVNEQNPLTSAQTGGTSRPPTPPLAPQTPADCAALKKQWSDLMGLLESEHEACLDANRARPPRPNSAAEVGRCSQAPCAGLHDRLFNPEWKKYRLDSEKWCDDRVRAYSEASQRFRDEQAKIARQRERTRQRLVEQARRTKERNDRIIAGLKEGITDQKKIADEAAHNSFWAKVWAGVETGTGAFEAYLGYTAPPAAGAFGVAKDLTTAVLNADELRGGAAAVKGLGGIEKLPLGEAGGEALGTGPYGGPSVGNATGSITRATGGALDTIDKLQRGDYIGGAIAGAKTTGEVLKTSEVSGVADFGKKLGTGASVASGGYNALKGVSHFLDAINEGERLQSLTNANIDQFNRRIESINAQTYYSQADAERRLRNLSEPFTSSIGTRWGVQSSGSVIDFRTGNIYYLDQAGNLHQR